jgi:hypothetical protein
VIRKLYFLFLLALLAFPVASFGQANAIDAAVNGYVLDSSKSSITGSHITLTNISTGISQETKHGYEWLLPISSGACRHLSFGGGGKRVPENHPRGDRP